MKKSVLYSFIGLAIIAIALSISVYLIKSKPQPKSDSGARNSINVKVKAVNYTDKSIDLKYRGRISAYDEVTLISEVAGKLLSGDIHFKTGENFKKNQVILNIYKQDVLATYKSGVSTFLQTLAAILPDMKVDFPDEYDKWNNFFNQITPDKYLPELPTINSTKEKVYLSSNSVLTNYYSLQQQEIELSKYTIRAPFNGTIVSTTKNVGGATTAGSELASILRTDRLEIVVPVLPSDAQWISIGDSASVIDSKGNNYEVKVSRISEFVDESTQTVNVYFSYFPSDHSKLLQGEYVDVTIYGKKVSGFEIPREALVDEKNIYVLKDKKLYKTKINVLSSLDDSYIINGLNAGDNAVIESLTIVNSNYDYLPRN